MGVPTKRIVSELKRNDLLLEELSDEMDFISSVLYPRNKTLTEVSNFIDQLQDLARTFEVELYVHSRFEDQFVLYATEVVSLCHAASIFGRKTLTNMKLSLMPSHHTNKLELSIHLISTGEPKHQTEENLRQTTDFLQFGIAHYNIPNCHTDLNDRAATVCCVLQTQSGKEFYD
ncbi:MAG: hypothetical protein AAGJ35_07560 [Myxococcota bacterium]